MKKHFLAFMLLGSFLFAKAQPVSTTKPEKSYGEYGTQTTTTSTDESLNKVTTTEWKDNKGIVRLRKPYKLGLDGTVIIEDECIRASGITEQKETWTLNGKDELVKHEFSNYTSSGAIKTRYEMSKVKGDTKELRGKFTHGEDKGKSITQSEDDVKATESYFFKAVLKIIRGNEAPVEPLKSSCAPAGNGSNCASRIEIFGGYSYLNEFGDDGESFPVGGQITALYNVGPRVGAGINVSYHSKKTGDQTLSRSFVMVEGRYILQDDRECDRDFLMDVHVLVGVGSERFKYKAGNNNFTSKGSGPAFGTGLSGVIRITPKTAAKAEADYLGIKFKNSDKLTGFIRGSAGIHINF